MHQGDCQSTLTSGTGIVRVKASDSRPGSCLNTIECLTAAMCQIRNIRLKKRVFFTDILVGVLDLTGRNIDLDSADHIDNVRRTSEIKHYKTLDIQAEIIIDRIDQKSDTAVGIRMRQLICCRSSLDLYSGITHK